MVFPANGKDELSDAARSLIGHSGARDMMHRDSVVPLELMSFRHIKFDRMAQCRQFFYQDTIKINLMSSRRNHRFHDCKTHA